MQTLIEQINNHKYLYLIEVNEPEVNTLRIVIEEAKAIGLGEDIKVGNVTLSECVPIESDESCYSYEIKFESYIAYSVRNESFTILDESEDFIGRLFCVYSKSHFLNYVQFATFASEDTPGKFTHYGLNCLDHVIDVVSIDKPEISVLRSPKIQG